MKVTRHAKSRLKQRCGVGRNSAVKQANKVFNVGLKHSDLSGNLRKWVDGLYLHNKTANNIRLYGDHAYLFCGHDLVTVLNIPQNLLEELREDRLRKNNAATYYKMKLNIPKEVRDIMVRLQTEGYRALLVGGCVRNGLLGLPVNDWDICTNAKPWEVHSILDNGQYIIDITASAFGMIGVQAGNFRCDISTFKTKEYSGGIRRADEFGQSLMEDVQKRDLTINALMYDISKQVVVDCIGGLNDLRERKIRFVGSTKDRLDEDYVRAIRALRIRNELNFDMSQDLVRRCRGTMIRAAYNEIYFPRVQREIAKLVATCKVVEYTKDIYIALANSYIPELKNTIGCEQNPKYHKYDVAAHTIRVVCDCVELEDTNKTTILKWAALLHDIGKPESKLYTETGVHFIGHPEKSAKLAEEILNRLGFNPYMADEIVFLVLNHDNFLNSTRISKLRRFVGEYGRERTELLIELMKADRKSHTIAGGCETGMARMVESYERICAENSDLNMDKLDISLADFYDIGIYDADKINLIMEFLLSECLGNPEINYKDWLINRAKVLGRKQI